MQNRDRDQVREKIDEQSVRNRISLGAVNVGNIGGVQAICVKVKKDMPSGIGIASTNGAGAPVNAKRYFAQRPRT